MSIDWEELTSLAEDAYAETQCPGAGCCGSVSHAIGVVRARVEEEIQDFEDRVRFLRDKVADLHHQLSEAREQGRGLR